MECHSFPRPCLTASTLVALASPAMTALHTIAAQATPTPTGWPAGTSKTAASVRDLRKALYVHRRTAREFAKEANLALRRAEDAEKPDLRRFHLECVDRARRALAVERAHHGRIAVQLAEVRRLSVVEI